MSNVNEELEYEGEPKEENPQPDTISDATQSFGTVKNFRAPWSTTNTPLTSEELESLKKD